MLSTNIQTINAKFSELEVFVEELNIINFKFSVICIQETWIDECEDISPFHLQGYACISQGKNNFPATNSIKRTTENYFCPTTFIL